MTFPWKVSIAERCTAISKHATSKCLSWALKPVVGAVLMLKIVTVQDNVKYTLRKSVWTPSRFRPASRPSWRFGLEPHPKSRAGLFVSRILFADSASLCTRLQQQAFRTVINNLQFVGLHSCFHQLTVLEKKKWSDSKSSSVLFLFSTDNIYVVICHKTLLIISFLYSGCFLLKKEIWLLMSLDILRERRQLKNICWVLSQFQQLAL